MSLIINHNISAMNTQRNLELSNGSLSKSLQKLSSGYKINTAADDPSGLIISEQLRSQTNSLERAVRNSQEASNVLGIAEGALIEINDMLRHLRGLAIHAANNGVTAADQISADQSELDSAIQTIDRIANTTKYSDQYLLNGSKGLIYKTQSITGNSLIDTAQTRLDSVFKTEGLILGTSFNGLSTTAGQALMTQQAEKAFFEADAGGASDDVSATTNQVTADQAFIVTGNNGSMQFNFSSGTDIAQVVAAVNNVSDSTGVSADLVLASGATATVEGTHANFANLGTWNLYGMETGSNTDANGQLYVEVTGAGPYTVNLYKNVAGGAANLVATGSGAAGATINFTDATTNYTGISGQVTLGAGIGAMAIGATTNLSARALTDATVNESGDSNNDLGTWILNGTEIGTNTDSEGRTYVDVVANGANWDINIYRDSDRTELVAKATNIAAGATGTLVEQNIDTDGDGVVDSPSGLTGFVDLSATIAASSSISLRPQLGARMYSNEYGSSQYVRVQANEGKMWESYNRKTAAYDRLDATTQSVTSQVFGQDATVSINGTDVLVNGIASEISTPVFSGRMVFDEGYLGHTTMAQVGYERGNSSSAIGMMYTNTNLAVNAGQNSSENIQDIQNGMQFQLGETDGDQSRTVYGIPSMNVPNLGRIELEGQVYTLQDVLGGGSASLSKDPVIAMKVLTQAINDVSGLRSRLGAFQSNMLQTNINSLNVTVENITATESAIRDANMAYETSEFTKNQILTQAGTAMLAQANTVSQNVLQLLG